MAYTLETRLETEAGFFFYHPGVFFRQPDTRQYIPCRFIGINKFVEWVSLVIFVVFGYNCSYVG